MESKSLFKLLDELNDVLLSLSGNQYLEFKKEKLTLKSENYTTVMLNDWTSEQKESLFIDALKGIHYYFYEYSKGKSFPVAGFNEITDAIVGKKTIQIYSKGIPKYSKSTIDLLVKKGIISIGKPNIKKGNSSRKSYQSGNWLADAAGTNDPETMNDVYWNLD